MQKYKENLNQQQNRQKKDPKRQISGLKRQK